MWYAESNNYILELELISFCVPCSQLCGIEFEWQGDRVQSAVKPINIQELVETIETADPYAWTYIHVWLTIICLRLSESLQMLRGIFR